jgi:hypothetical protein
VSGHNGTFASRATLPGVTNSPLLCFVCGHGREAGPMVGTGEYDALHTGCMSVDPYAEQGNKGKNK